MWPAPRYLLCGCLLLAVCLLDAGQPVPRVSIRDIAPDKTRRGIIHADIPFESLGVKWVAGGPVTIRVRGSADGLRWSEWSEVRVDAHATEEGPREFTGALIYLGRNTEFVEYQADPAVAKLRLFFLDPGETPPGSLGRGLFP